jgi:hypothetical protein
MKTKKQPTEVEKLLSAGKIVKIVAYKAKKDKTAYCMLFEDGKTIMELEEQDPYTYHDCNYSARILTVFQDEVSWKNRMTHEAFEDAKHLS